MKIIHSLATVIPTSLQCKLNFYTMKKTAIIILSDPKAGTEEALGRVFNASAYEFKHAGEDVKIIFQGTGINLFAYVIVF